MSNKATIKDIVDIQIGYQFRGKIEPSAEGVYSVIQIRDINEQKELVSSNVTKVELDRDVDQYKVKKGDVLFLSKGNHNYALTVIEDLENTIAASYFFILSIKSSQVLPEYLAWYINQAPAQHYLYKLARRGSHMPMIPKSAFLDMPVETPPIEIQKTIVELSKLEKREQKLLSEIAEKRKLLITAAALKAAQNLVN